MKPQHGPYLSQGVDFHSHTCQALWVLDAGPGPAVGMVMLNSGTSSSVSGQRGFSSPKLCLKSQKAFGNKGRSCGGVARGWRSVATIG